MHRPVQTAVLRHKRWRVQDSAEIPDGHRTEGERLLGICIYSDKTIHVPKEGETLVDLDVILHEGLHACTELDEQAVDETASSLALLLWRLGWRKGI